MVAIETGLWRDFASGTRVLTLPLRESNILLQALALLVNLAGVSFWHLTAYFLHAWKVRRRPGHAGSDGGSVVGATTTTTTAVDLQHQVSLRNSGSGIGTAWEMLVLLHAWSSPPATTAKRKAEATALSEQDHENIQQQSSPRSLSRRLAAHTILIALAGIAVWMGFIVASLMTSSVANKAEGVAVARVREDLCGFWQYNKSDPYGYGGFRTKVLRDTIQARAYVGSFYNTVDSSGSDPSSSARSIFVRPRLPYTTDTSAPCPLPDASRCFLGPNSALSMTTDLLDSQEMLGINSPAEEKVGLRISVTCAPVSTRDYIELVETNNNTFWAWSIGPAGTPVLEEVANFTYLYNLRTPNTDATYIIAPLVHYAPSNATAQNIWDPIAEFNRTDADVSVFFLSQNNLYYMTPVFDPWFLANGTYRLNTSSLGFPFELYQPNFRVGTLACADQFSACNPNNGVCTSPSGGGQLLDAVLTRNDPGFNAAQLATVGRLVFPLSTMGTYNSVAGLGAAVLWASEAISEHLSLGLPEDQWRREVLGWFQTSLAKLQAYAVAFASNGAASRLGEQGFVALPSSFSSSSPSSSSSGQDFVGNLVGRTISSSEAEEGLAALRRQCSNQLVLTSAEVQNFNFAGVLVIVCVSVGLVVLDLCLDSIVDMVSRWRNRRKRSAGQPTWMSATRRARQADDKWHLLRMAPDGASGANGQPSGAGWKLGRWGVPVRTDGHVGFERPAMMATAVDDDGAGALVSYQPSPPVATPGTDGDWTGKGEESQGHANVGGYVLGGHWVRQEYPLPQNLGVGYQ